MMIVTAATTNAATSLPITDCHAMTGTPMTMAARKKIGFQRRSPDLLLPSGSLSPHVAHFSVPSGDWVPHSGHVTPAVSLMAAFYRGGRMAGKRRDSRVVGTFACGTRYQPVAAI